MGSTPTVGNCFLARLSVVFKRKFGDSVRSKNDVAMVNEVYCKFIAHNLCCLIMEQETLGIVPVLWKDEPTDETRDVLPMVRA